MFFLLLLGRQNTKKLKINEKKIYKIIKKYHNYDIPEILTLKLENIENDYMKWASGEIN